MTSSGPRGFSSARVRDGLCRETILIWAVQCLYQDEALPYCELLRWFLHYLLGVRLSLQQLSALIVETPGLRLERQSKRAFSAVLDEPPPGFQGFASQDDALATLDEDTLEELSSCLGRGGWPKAQDTKHRFYVVTAWLEEESPRFGEMSFGRVLNIVRCSLCSRGVMWRQGLLGQRSGLLVPYLQSEEYERTVNACVCQPTHVAPDEQYVKTWGELRQGLITLVQKQEEGVILISRVKPMFRTLLKTELSETVFGHQGLSKLLTDPELSEDLSVEMMRGGQYVLRLKREAPPAVELSNNL